MSLCEGKAKATERATTEKMTMKEAIRNHKQQEGPFLAFDR